MVADLYEILGVKKNASSTLIRQAFRRLAEIYIFKIHNDEKQQLPESEGDKQRLNAIIAAYTVLGDTQKRQAYNNALKANANNVGLATTNIQTLPFQFFSRQQPQPAIACYYFFRVIDEPTEAQNLVESYAISHISRPGTLYVCVYTTTLDLNDLIRLINQEFDSNKISGEDHDSVEIAHHKSTDIAPECISVITSYPMMEKCIDEMLKQKLCIRCYKDVNVFPEDQPSFNIELP